MALEVGTPRILSAWGIYVCLFVAHNVHGHGAMVSPIPRNAFDRVLPQFAGGRGSGCSCGSPALGCDVGAVRASTLGQSCYWFSQGCFIGCAACTGTNIEPDGMREQNETNSTARTCTRGYPPAGSSFMPTLPKRLWTMNLAAGEDSIADIYRYHPWRAPGSAPVADCCGKAGGTNRTFAGPGHAQFTPVVVNNTGARLGDLGSRVLPPGAPTATWALGANVEVKWALRYNHGGGYQYRLCPASENLTEDCFAQHPLEFVRGSQALEWSDGTRVHVPEPQYIDEGVIPVGATWARNPVPVISGAHSGCLNTTGNLTAATATDASGRLCRQFDPPCEGDDSWSLTPGSSDPSDVMGKCSNNWIDGVIVDQITIPVTLPAGRYVLGFRWDCEQTSQVWSSCSDVELVSSVPIPV